MHVSFLKGFEARYIIGLHIKDSLFIIWVFEARTFFLHSCVQLLSWRCRGLISNIIIL